MNASELKYQVDQHNTESHFFDHKTMRFFGDTMHNYGVRPATITDYQGDTFECWELYRQHPVKHGLTASAYFDKETFERRYPSPNP